MSSLFALDIKTILALLVVSNLGVFCILLAYRRPRGAELPLRLFLAGTGDHAIAWALLSQRGLWPDLLSVYVGNSILLCGFGLECLAIASAEERSAALDRLFSGVTAAGIVGFCAFAGSPNGRVAAASLATCGIFAVLSAVLFLSKRTSALRLVMASVAALYCVAHVARAAYSIRAGSGFGLLSPATVQTAAFLPLFLFLVGGTVGFILLLKEKGDRALRDSEEQYRSLVERASEAVVIGQDERFAFANDRMAELVGVPVEKLLGNAFADYIWPADRERTLASFRARIAGGSPPECYDLRIAGPDGQPVWTSMSSSIIHWKGRPATLSLLTDISERKRSEERIAALLAEKETLLKEVHHRIKNNLSVAMSLLSLQADSCSGKDPAAAMLDARNRMQSLVKLYDLLHASGQFREMRVSDFLGPLAAEIVGSFPGGERVRLELELGDFPLDAGRLTTLGLLVNEVVTNSMKYAFEGLADPAIRIEASLFDGRVRVACGDNGRGLPPGFEPEDSGGMGMQLVPLLASQLGARFAMERGIDVERGRGLRYVVEFPI
jgi:PAS domain S-box